MKTDRKLASLRLGLGLSLWAMPFVANAQTAPVTCSAATMTGTHSLTLTGRAVSSAAVVSKVSFGTGKATFDGAGNVTFNLVTNTNAAASTTQTLSGTYTLPSNCLGTLTITSGDTASFIFIPYNTGLGFSLTGQDATYSFTGTGTVTPTACINATLSGVYVFSGNGYSLASTVISGVNTVSGLLKFDGVGTVSGNWSVATSGTSAPATNVTGTYSVAAPGCVATATVTDQNNVSYALTFTATTADGANFSFSGAAPAISFTGNGHSTFTNPGLAVEAAAGASLTTPPGSLFSIYGFGLSNGTSGATTTTWPTTLSGAQVLVNGELAPLYGVNNTALGAEGIINAEMPLDIKPGLATVVVKNGTTLSNTVAITIPSTPIPAVLVYNGTHTLAQNFPDYSLNSSSNAAPAGSTVIVYFTGGGTVQGQSSLVTGQATPSAQFPVTAAYSVTVAGTAASMTGSFVGLVPTLIGLYQADFVVPKVAAGDHNLVLTVGGVNSNVTTISTK